MSSSLLPSEDPDLESNDDPQQQTETAGGAVDTKYILVAIEPNPEEKDDDPTTTALLDIEHGVGVESEVDRQDNLELITITNPGVVEIQHDEDSSIRSVTREDDEMDSMHHFRQENDPEDANELTERLGGGDASSAAVSRTLERTELSVIELLLSASRTASECDALANSKFTKFGGILEEVVVLNILVYVNATDLCRVGLVSRFFYRISQKAPLWARLYAGDFIMDDVISTSAAIETSSVASTNPTAPLPSLFVAAPSSTASPSATYPPQSQSTYSKSAYAKRFAELNQRVIRAKEERTNAEAELRRSERVQSVEQMLDVMQVRLVFPIMIAAFFLTILFLCRKIDQQISMSYFECFIPIWISIGYTVLCCTVVSAVHSHQFDAASILYGLWTNFRGPYKGLFAEVLKESQLMLYGFYFLLFLVVSETLLISIKMSSSISESVRHDLDWGFVFIPLWLMMFSFCFLPLINPRMEFGFFLLSIALFWIPFATLFICLTVKLTGQDEGSSDRKIPLSLIFVPFWLIEGFVLVASLVCLFVGICCGRNGGRIDEFLVIFVMSWVTTAPFVIFQALLSVRDAELVNGGGESAVPNATETATPLLIMLGLIWIGTTLISMGYTTQFQGNRARTMHTNAGLRIIYQF